MDKVNLVEYLTEEIIKDENETKKKYNNLSENKKREILDEYKLSKILLLSVDDKKREEQENVIIMEKIRELRGKKELIKVQKKLLKELCCSYYTQYN
jgi:hypothetical protein